MTIDKDLIIHCLKTLVDPLGALSAPRIQLCFMQLTAHA